MSRFVYRNGKVIPIENAAYDIKSHAPYVISDTMEPIKHMATGRMLDSKAKFRADTRASGCCEIGNEPIRPRTPIRLDKGQRRNDIRKALYDLRKYFK